MNINRYNKIIFALILFIPKLTIYYNTIDFYNIAFNINKIFSADFLSFFLKKKIHSFSLFV